MKMIIVVIELLRTTSDKEEFVPKVAKKSAYILPIQRG
jgi:hypothetical protein